MKRIHIERRKLDLKEYTYRVAQEGDCSKVIDEPTIVYEGEEIKIVYCEMEERLPDLVLALETINYERNFRTGGLPTNSRIFGYSPRSTLRKDFCATTSLANQFPKEHAAICRRAQIADKYYELWHPTLHQAHQGITAEKVLPQWHLEESVFTSGIVNKNNPLRYHHDTGNFKNVWSAMMVFKNAVSGGGLAVPEYDLMFTLSDHSLLMFDGQGLLHGVTPFSLKSPSGYRYSIVYYSLRQMWNCLAPAAELSRIRKLKTQREYKRAGIQ
jgi:hypothetical protein